VKIYATDVDEEALTQARQGSYDAKETADVPEARMVPASSRMPPPEAPAAEMRLKEVTSAPKHVSTSASVLPKSG